jgi:plasmid stability protein
VCLSTRTGCGGRERWSTRSTEAEVRDVLATAATAQPGVLIGDALAALGRQLDLTDQDLAIMESVREPPAATPMVLP